MAADQDQIEKAKQLQSLHDEAPILVLPNAWDVGSALVLQDAGAKAVATASAGIAYTLGVPDGEVATRGQMLEAVGRIAKRLSVPVSADMETGYGDTPQEVAETTRLTIDAGAVGINLEDSRKDQPGVLRSADEMAERVSAAYAAAKDMGVPIVINARTDVFSARIGEKDGRLAHAVERANAYRSAGAGSLFVPGVRDPETIAALAKAIDGPLNILATPGCPPVAELDKLGVARLTVGPGLAHAALGATRRAAEALLNEGDLGVMFDGAPSFPEMLALMKGS